MLNFFPPKNLGINVEEYLEEDFLFVVFPLTLNQHSQSFTVWNSGDLSDFFSPSCERLLIPGCQGKIFHFGNINQRKGD